MEPTHSGKTLVPALAVLDNSDYATEDKMYLLLHWQDDLQELRSLRQVKSPSRLVRAGMRAGTTMKISESPSEALSLLSLSLSAALGGFPLSLSFVFQSSLLPPSLPLSEHFDLPPHAHSITLTHSPSIFSLSPTSPSLFLNFLYLFFVNLSISLCVSPSLSLSHSLSRERE